MTEEIKTLEGNELCDLLEFLKTTDFRMEYSEYFIRQHIKFYKLFIDDIVFIEISCYLDSKDSKDSEDEYIISSVTFSGYYNGKGLKVFLPVIPEVLEVIDIFDKKLVASIQDLIGYVNDKKETVVSPVYSLKY